MFAMSSRYYGLPTGEYRRPDGAVVVYARRRPLPQPEELAEVGEHVVAPAERLDHIAARQYGDPEQAWRIADANRAMRTEDLTATPGRRLRITLPPGISGAGLNGLVLGGNA
jgi:hypothetical protein